MPCHGKSTGALARALTSGKKLPTVPYISGLRNRIDGILSSLHTLETSGLSNVQYLEAFKSLLDASAPCISVLATEEIPVQEDWSGYEERLVPIKTYRSKGLPIYPWREKRGKSTAFFVGARGVLMQCSEKAYKEYEFRRWEVTEFSASQVPVDLARFCAHSVCLSLQPILLKAAKKQRDKKAEAAVIDAVKWPHRSQQMRKPNKALDQTDNATLTDKSREPERGSLEVEAQTREEAKTIAASQMPPAARITTLRVVDGPRKGFLSLGKHPGRYRVYFKIEPGTEPQRRPVNGRQPSTM